MDYSGKDLVDSGALQVLGDLNDRWLHVAFCHQIALYAMNSISYEKIESWERSDWLDGWLVSTQLAILSSLAVILLAEKSGYSVVAVLAHARALSAARDDAEIKHLSCRDSLARMVIKLAADAADIASKAATLGSGWNFSQASINSARRAILVVDGWHVESMVRRLDGVRDPVSFIRASVPSMPGGLQAISKFQRQHGRYYYWGNLIGDFSFHSTPSIDKVLPLLSLSREIRGMAPDKVTEYLLADVLRGLHAPKSLNSVRCMIVGFGYVGKTSLSRVLRGKAVDPEEKKTSGFDIQPWAPPGNPQLDVRLWDFAGQAMAHSCHRLFFTERCVYVIVVAGAGRQQEERLDGLLRSPTDQAEYWFEAIRPNACEEGKKVPVLLLANKDDAGRVDLDMPHLQRRFGCDFDFADPYYLSLQHAEGYADAFQSFKGELTQRLTEVNQWQTPLPPEHYEVYRWVCEQSKTTTWLDMDAFTKACDDRSISREAKPGELSQSFLLKLLAMQGMTFDFSTRSKDSCNSLEDQLLLRPQWLSQAINYLVRGASAQAGSSAGRSLELGEVTRLMNQESSRLGFCRKEQCRGVLQAMEKAGLAYLLNGGWVIPDALPDREPPSDAAFQSEVLSCHFAFPYAVPGQIFSQLMCALHSEVEDGKVWRRGMVLGSTTYQVRALVRVDYGLRRITLLVTGEGRGMYLEYLLGICRKVFDDANITDYAEWLGLPDKPDAVPLPPVRPTTAERVVDLRDLEQLRLFGQRYYYGKFGRFDLAKVMKIMIASSRKKDSNKGEGKSVSKRKTVIKADKVGRLQIPSATPDLSGRVLSCHTTNSAPPSAPLSRSVFSRAAVSASWPS